MKKKYLSKLFLFLCPILSVLIGIEIFYRTVPNTYSYKNDIMLERKDASILIFGNSHSYYGLNPIFFSEKALNLANISQPIYFDQFLFNEYMQTGNAVKVVILGIDYFTLSKLDDTEEDTWRKFYYQSYMDLDVPIIKWWEQGNYFLSTTRNFNSNYLLVKQYFEKSTLIECDSNGFGTSYKKEDKRTDSDKLAPLIAKKHEDNLFDFEINKQRIQEIITICKERKIKVILITMPVTKPYSDHVNPEKLKKIFLTCKALQQSNDNTYYLNMFQDSRFSDSDFYDVDHLHDDGAKKCSSIVNDYINRLN